MGEGPDTGSSGVGPLVSGAIVVIAALVGCSGIAADPAFVSVAAVAVPACADGLLCVEVRAPVDGSREGEGSCAVYGPGSPDDLEPLAKSDQLELRPDETTTWTIELSSRLEVADLNPVCQPMIEG